MEKRRRGEEKRRGKYLIYVAANQGIGFEIVKQIAKQSNKDVVYLGSRNTERGIEAEYVNF